MTKQNILLKLHRYIALCISPFLLVILISGAVLSFKPILAPEAGGVLSQEQLPVLQKIENDIGSDKISAVHFSLNAKQVYVDVDKVGTQVFDAQTGQFIENAGMKLETYQWFKSLHKKMLLGLGDLVTWTTYLFLASMLFGFAMLMKPRANKTLMSIHNLLAWVFMPLVVMLPITAILLDFKVGAPDYKKTFADTQVLPISVVADLVNKQPEVGLLQGIEMKRGRFQTILTKDNNQNSQSFTVNSMGELQSINNMSYLPKELHVGTWTGNRVGAWVNFGIVLLLIFFTLSGCYSYVRRLLQNRVPSSIPKADVLIAFASQTGTAKKLAQATHEALQNSHISSACAPLSAITVEQLQSHEKVFFIVSTTGKGDNPEQLQSFIKNISGHHLLGLNYSVLALGDSHYEHFCQAGKNLNQLLEQAQATQIMPLECIDGDVNQPWQDWLQKVAIQLQVPLSHGNSVVGDLNTELELVSRKCLSNQAVREVWQLDFKPSDALAFRPGDLILITPPSSSIARCYSVGSSSLCEEVVRLTVGLEKNPETDNGFGLASYYLCQDLAIGSQISAKLRQHADFHPQTNSAKKMIMIGTGTGMASFPGFMKERELQQEAGQTWLFFGNNAEDEDFYYKDAWQKWLQEGTLTKMDTAFSKTENKFVQDKMLDNTNELFEWVVNDKAHVYICGRSNTIGVGALNALKKIYQDKMQVSEALAQKWLLECQKKGQIHMDLFG